MEEALHFDLAGDITQDVRAVAVGPDERVGIDDGAVHMGFGGEVHDGVVAGHRSGHGLAVADVALDEGESGIVVEAAQVVEVARIGQGVESCDGVVGCGQDVPHVVGADEPGGTSDEESHGQVRRAWWGRRAGPRSERCGFCLSRSERIGSASPQSASMSGSSQATPSSSAGLW